MNEHAPIAVGVRFRRAGKLYFFDAANFPNLRVSQYVIVETPRGKEAARVVIAPKQIALNELEEPLKPIFCIASDDDLRQMLEYKSRERSSLQTCNEKVLQHDLPMKLIEAEYAYDGSRLTFYFYSDDRVDFRALVRDLAVQFHTRIELRQIGYRDHAKLLGGLGPCGRQLCCSTWLADFGAVSIKMAKEQSLPLNPTKISGVCGRLMCCLAFENDTYIEAKESMPDVGEEFITPDGPGKVVAQNVPKYSIDVQLESGVIISVPLQRNDPSQTSASDDCGIKCSTREKK